MTFAKTNGTIRPALLLVVLTIAACSEAPQEPPRAVEQQVPSAAVESSGKEKIPLDALPHDVSAAARDARPNMNIVAVEHELRNGNEYYDVAGHLPDGAEIELDITRVSDRWTVVEVQRDIVLDAVPEEVSAALAQASPSFQVDRIIESDQGNGLVIYEFFGVGPDAEERKIEVRYEGTQAEVLASEWEH